MTDKYFSTGLKAKPQSVNRARGIVKGVKICTAGGVKGQSFSLDGDFIAELVKQGNACTGGLKSRFGHPNMFKASIGTYLGRFKSFRKGTTVSESGERVSCCFADLHLSESAKMSPRGDLHSYLLTMAENEADMFGTSIVVEFGNFYTRTSSGEKDFYYDEDAGEPVYVECKELVACDFEDDPAANDGLFSCGRKRKLTMTEVSRLGSMKAS